MLQYTKAAVSNLVLTVNSEDETCQDAQAFILGMIESNRVSIFTVEQTSAWGYATNSMLGGPKIAVSTKNFNDPPEFLDTLFHEAYHLIADDWGEGSDARAAAYAGGCLSNM